MFGRLLGCYIVHCESKNKSITTFGEVMHNIVVPCFLTHSVYTFSGALAPDRILSGAKFTLRLSLAFCTALQQRMSAKLCGVVQGMEFTELSQRGHLYSAGRPSRWASAHILVERIALWCDLQTRFVRTSWVPCVVSMICCLPWGVDTS